MISIQIESSHFRTWITFISIPRPTHPTNLNLRQEGFILAFELFYLHHDMLNPTNKAIVPQCCSWHQRCWYSGLQHAHMDHMIMSYWCDTTWICQHIKTWKNRIWNDMDTTKKNITNIIIIMNTYGVRIDSKVSYKVMINHPLIY